MEPALGLFSMDKERESNPGTIVASQGVLTSPESIESQIPSTRFLEVRGLWALQSATRLTMEETSFCSGACLSSRMQNSSKAWTQKMEFVIGAWTLQHKCMCASISVWGHSWRLRSEALRSWLASCLDLGSCAMCVGCHTCLWVKKDQKYTQTPKVMDNRGFWELLLAGLKGTLFHAQSEFIV